MAGIIQGSRTQPGRGGVTTLGGLPPFPTVEAVRATFTDHRAQERAEAAREQREAVLPGGLPPFPGTGGGGGAGRGAGYRGDGVRLGRDDGRRIGYRGTLEPTDRTGANWVADHGGLAMDYGKSFGGLDAMEWLKHPPVAGAEDVGGGGGGAGPAALPEWKGPTKWGADGVVQRAMPLPPFPGRANGGPVAGGQPYVVGEEGPELFLPEGPGVIVPNGALPDWETIVAPGNAARPVAGSLDRVALNEAGQAVGFGSNLPAGSAQPTPLPEWPLVPREEMVARGEMAGRRLQEQALPPWPPLGSAGAGAGAAGAGPAVMPPWYEPTRDMGAWNQRGANREAKRFFENTREGRMAAGDMARNELMLEDRVRRQEELRRTGDELLQARESERADRIDERADRKLEADKKEVLRKEGETKVKTDAERALELSAQQQRLNNLVLTGALKKEEVGNLGGITDPKVLGTELDRLDKYRYLEKQNNATMNKPGVPEPTDVPEGFVAVPTAFNAQGQATGWRAKEARQKGAPKTQNFGTDWSPNVLEWSASDGRWVKPSIDPATGQPVAGPAATPATAAGAGESTGKGGSEKVAADGKKATAGFLKALKS